MNCGHVTPTYWHHNKGEMFINPYWIAFGQVDDYWHLLVFITSLILFMVGLAANAIVLVYYVKFEKSKGAYSYLLVNLMMVDLLMIISNLPFLAICSIYKKWLFGQVGCNLYGFCASLSGFVSISTMVLISIERYLVIKDPFSALRTDNTSITVLLIGAWLYGIIWSALPLFGQNQYVLEGYLTSCSFDMITRDSYNTTIILLMNIFAFILPLGVIVKCYSYIMFSVRNKNYKFTKSLSGSDYSACGSSVEYTPGECIQLQARTGGQQQQPSSLARSHDITSMYSIKGGDHGINVKSSKKSVALELQITKNVIILISVFFLTWIPYGIISILSQFVEDREHFVTPHTILIPTLIAKTSTIINPIIYIFRSRKFKSKIRRSQFARHSSR